MIPNKGEGRDGKDKSNREKHSGTGEKKFLTPDGIGTEKSPSLQRIHQQSSTETSGLGETIASGFSSQESVRSTHSYLNEAGERCNHEAIREQYTSGKNPNEKASARRMKGDIDRKPLIYGSHLDRGNHTQEHDTAEDQPETMQTKEAPNFDELFQKPPTQQNTFPGLQVEEIDRNWVRRSSVKSRSSYGGSFRSRSGSNNFLGKSLESAWTRWSKERRASFQRGLEPPEDTAPMERASTPVKKARIEGMQFIHPDYINEEDKHYVRQHKQQRNQTYHVIEKSKKSVRNAHSSTEVILTENQWHILSDFWEHQCFTRSRYAAVFFGFITIIIMIVSITNGFWIKYILEAEGDNVRVYEGLFRSCNETDNGDGEIFLECHNLSRGFSAGMWDTCYQPKSQYNESCGAAKQHWQNAVIGLMIFAASFGFVASVLAICGVCTSPLPKKIYYFHSAGEIFLVCALSTGVALIMYPVAIEIDESIASHQYGSGYGLGWGSAFFFLTAAFCMSLDELVRESSKAKCCRLCWKSRQNERSELQPV